jgi:hypothetical protein
MLERCGRRYFRISHPCLQNLVAGGKWQAGLPVDEGVAICVKPTDDIEITQNVIRESIR